MYTYWRKNLEKYVTSHFIVRVLKGYSRFYGERELETEHNCNVLTPTLMAVSVVSFSFNRAAQPEAQRLSFLLSAGFLYHILSTTSLDSNSSGAPRAPSAWCGLLYHISSITPTVWLLVLTELYNSSTPTQSPTQSLEWHVWSSSCWNNCHAVHRSLSSSASLWSGTFTLSHIISWAHQRDFLCHWNVSLPSGASLWIAFLAGSKVKIQHM